VSGDAAAPSDTIGGGILLRGNSSAVDVWGVGEQERIHTTSRLVGSEPSHTVAISGSGVEDLD